MPHVTYGPDNFASAVHEDNDSPEHPSVSLHMEEQESMMHYRPGTLVFIKPAKGSFEVVFIAQLLDPVIEVKTAEQQHPRRSRRRG